MPSPGGLDPTFGTGGLVTTNFSLPANDDIFALLLQTDQKIVAVGRTYASDIRFSFALARYNTNGTLDTTGFNSGGSFPGTVTTDVSAEGHAYAAVLQSDGKVLAVGWSSVTSVTVAAQFTIVRYNTNGSLDTGFGSPNGYVRTAIGSFTDVGSAVVLDADQKIIVVGSTNTTSFGSTNHTDVAVVRYNTDGSLDTTFNSTGKQTLHVGNSSNGYAVAVQDDGKIVVAGHTGLDILVARFNSNGSLDTTGFGSPNGYVVTDYEGTTSSAQGVIIQDDGKIVVAGFHFSLGTANGVFISVRYNTDGSLDSTYGDAGISIQSFGSDDDEATGLILHYDGRIIVYGSTHLSGPNYTFAMVALNDDGTPDTTFGTAGFVTTSFGAGTSFVQSAIFQDDGNIVLGGVVNDDVSVDYFGLARYAGFSTPIPPTSTVATSRPNTFGHPGQGFSLIDPRAVRVSRMQLRRDCLRELDLANSYYSTVGLWPDVGWLLIPRRDLNEIDFYATDLQLVITDFVNAPLILNGLTIVQARCVTRGIASDPNAIYLVQVTNSEGIVYNPWFQFPTTSQYNVRAPAYDQGYYSGSLSGGVTPWTWDTMLEDLWDQASTILGVYPGLPITPAGTPENFSFVGMPLWEAINRVLDHLGMTVTGSNGGFTITVCGATDPAYNSLTRLYLKYLEDSMEYLGEGSGRVPSQVVVYFHRRGQVYGIEETERQDSLQWQTDAFYSVTVAAPAVYTTAAGTAYVWSDFAVRYDMDGVPLPADTATAATIAAERATQFFKEIRAGVYKRDTYVGLLPFTTGSQVDGVRWFNTGVDARHDDRWSGWRTEVVQGYEWPEVRFKRFN